MRISKFLFFKNPDFNKTASDCAKYRRGFPTEFFNHLQSTGLINPGKKVVDLGTGTGAIARKLAVLNCEVTGIDPSLELLNEARKLDKIMGIRINYLSATAEKTTLPNHTYDLAVVGQAWHWFDQKKTIVEIKRILKLEGALVIAHYEWVTQMGNVPELTEALMKKYNPNWTKIAAESGIYNQWASQLRAYNFFTKIEQLDVVEHYTHEQWRGRVRASPAISGVLTSEELAQFDREHAQALEKNFPSLLIIPHRCYILNAYLPGLVLHKQNVNQDSRNFVTKLCIPYKS